MAKEKAAKTGSKADVAKLGVLIPPIISDTLRVTVVGDTPLILNRWSQKAKQQMRDKQILGIRARKQPKKPKELFEAAKYKSKSGQEGMSILSFKAAMVDAAQHVDGVKMKFLKGCFFITADFYDADHVPCVRIQGKAKMREDVVHVGMGTADLRYRPEYSPWKVTLLIQYRRDLITPDQVVNLLNQAGFSGGVGEWRPSSPMGKSGEFGRFHVQTRKEGHG